MTRRLVFAGDNRDMLGHWYLHQDTGCTETVIRADYDPDLHLTELVIVPGLHEVEDAA